MTIIISKNGSDAKKIEKSGFEHEDYLQKYIQENPKAIPVEEIEEGIRVLIVAREFSTKSGPIDALGIDDRGNIYITETKLYKNSDKRKVLAQVLDYGASLWKHSHDYDEFVRELNRKVRKRFDTSLDEKVMDVFELDSDEEVSAIHDNLKENLDKGNFKFIVLMDELEDRLKDLVIFMNSNTNFDIYAVELDFYKYEENEIMIPKLFGAQVKKESKSTKSERRVWTKEDFMEETEQMDDKEESKIIKDLFDFAEEISDKSKFGSGTIVGSFTAKIDYMSKTPTLFTVKTNGKITVNWGNLRDNGVDENIIEEFIEGIEKVIGRELETDRYYEDLPASSLKKGDRLEGFKEVIRATAEKVLKKPAYS